MLHEATLLPKPGYVEVEIDGKRTYRNAVTGVLIENEVRQATETEVLQAQVSALTKSNQMLEDCLVEMAGVVYA